MKSKFLLMYFVGFNLLFTTSFAKIVDVKTFVIELISKRESRKLISFTLPSTTRTIEKNCRVIYHCNCFKSVNREGLKIRFKWIEHHRKGVLRTANEHIHWNNKKQNNFFHLSAFNNSFKNSSFLQILLIWMCYFFGEWDFLRHTIPFCGFCLLQLFF